MLFNSKLFIFGFLPVVLGVYWALISFKRVSLALWWLLIASLVFYASKDSRYTLILVDSIGFNYFAACWLCRISDRGRAKWLLGAAVGANLCLLGYFKYSHFFSATAKSVWAGFPVLPTLALPLGISFFTFTQIVYLVDAYRGTLQKAGPRDYALFVTFFPHLIAGPIVHHWQLLPQLQVKERRFDWSYLSAGLTIFILGLAEKVLIADTMAGYASPVFASAVNHPSVTFYDGWAGALSYTVQLYFDFDGYCNMAIGLSKMCGIRLPMNFNSPYKATSVIDFWRRWHITLSSFLRDYVYVPLGGNRRGALRRNVNLLVTMLLGGLWHGAGWTFVLWGGLHGFYLTVNHLWRNALKVPRGEENPSPSRWASAAGFCLTFLCVTSGWVIFRARDLPSAGKILSAMFLLNGSMPSLDQWWTGEGGILRSLGFNFGDPKFDVTVFLLIAIALIIACCLPNVQQWMARSEPVLEEVKPARRPWSPNFVSGIFVGGLMFWIVKTMIVSPPGEFLYSYF